MNKASALLKKRVVLGFTLIELLIVITIVAILSAVVVAIIKPDELLKQARDTQRTTDLDSLSIALKNAEFDGLNMGTSTIIYTSLPDSSSTCGNYGFTAPSGYTYRCATSANYQKVDGTGWIPVNFTSVSTINLSLLPVDPINEATSSLYYSYIPGGSFELNTLMESSAFNSGGARDISTNDGGNNSFLYEKGTNLSLNPDGRVTAAYGNCTDSNVAAYFSLDGSSGDLTVPTGCAASGTTFTQRGTPTYRVTSGVPKGLDGAITFNGSTGGFATAGDVAALEIGSSDAVIEGWVKNVGTGQSTQIVVAKRIASTGQGWGVFFTSPAYTLSAVFKDSTNACTATTSGTYNDSTWHYFRATWVNSTHTGSLAVDGGTAVTCTNNSLSSITTTASSTIAQNNTGSSHLGGSIADVRVTIGNSTNNLGYNNHWLPQP